jgi:hypothetical protein
MIIITVPLLAPLTLALLGIGCLVFGVSKHNEKILVGGLMSIVAATVIWFTPFFNVIK